MVPRHSPEQRRSTGPDRPVQLVGRRVRKVRKDRRLTLEDLASTAGIQPGDLARLEKGEYRASLDVLFRILGALEVSGEAFFADLAKDAQKVHEGNGIRPL
jgi:transcriptional regulator with XRE-family HTH domain